jgi:sugar lactone lactonase YvrE
MKTLTPKLLYRDTAIVGECPVWDGSSGRLLWVDIQGRTLRRLDPASGRDEVFPLPDLVTSVHQRERGGFILTLRKEFAFYDPETGHLELLADPEPNLPENRFNDAACDQRGRLWAGTMNAQHWAEPEGDLYLFDESLVPVRKRKKVVCSNGTGWSPDGLTMYHTESFRYAIFAYDYDPDTASITNRRVFLQLDPDGGEFPDGLTVDTDGYVWSAHVGRGRIVRYDPDGQAEREVQLPVTRGTSCAFGGPALDRLFITTARETLNEAQLQNEPLAGSLFVVDPGCHGMVKTAFRG